MEHSFIKTRWPGPTTSSSFQKIPLRPPPRWSGVPSAALWRLWRPAARWTRRPSSSRWGCWLRLPSWRRLCTASSTKTANPKRISCWRWICLWRRIHWKWLWGIPAKLWPAPAWYHTMQFGSTVEKCSKKTEQSISFNTNNRMYLPKENYLLTYSKYCFSLISRAFPALKASFNINVSVYLQH